MFMPTVKKVTKTGVETMDLSSYSFQEYRDIYIAEPITDELSIRVITQLKYLDQSEGDIHLYINSPGGSVTAGMAIYDAIRCCKNDVATICTGMAASMGAFLLAAGTKGKRMATPHSEIMIHQPLGGAQGQASDIELVARHIVRVKRGLNIILAERTGKTLEEIARDCDRDYYLSAEEAADYGLIDSVLTEHLY